MATTFPLDDLCVVWLPSQTPLVFGTTLFANILPDTPAAAVAVYEYPGGEGQDTFQDPNLPAGLPTIAEHKFQVVVRDPNAQTARSTIDTVHKALAKVVNLTINGARYLRIAPNQEPFFLHRDAQRRVYYACNYTASRTPN